MSKKLQDITSGKAKKIVLKKEDANSEKGEKIKPQKNVIYKKTRTATKLEDIKGNKKTNFLYIKGEKFSPPKFLGNLIKIGAVGLLIVILINSINVYYKGKAIEKHIEESAKEGYSQILDAGKSASEIQFDNAVAAFEKALDNFSQAEQELWFINTDKTFYAENKNAGQSINSLLETGKYFSLSGKYFTEALEEFNKIPVYFVSKNENPRKESPSITDTLKIGLEKTNLAIEQINLASTELETINSKNLPLEIQTRVDFLKSNVNKAFEILKSISDHFPAMLKLLGDRYPHRYMILFQNNDEIRATGGFIGSYAILDVNEGYIENLKIHDVYDIDGSYGGYIKPPLEMKSITSNWRLRDSNYSPDFPTSAAKAKWFLEKEGGPSVDTVIAINQGLLKDMLEITGPIQVGDFGKLNSENYNLLLTFIIETKVWGEEDPKHILKVFVPEFKKEILKEEHLAKVTSKIYRAIQQKHIMVWSGDPDIQALLDAGGLTGRMHKSEEGEDYLSVVNVSIGGNKTDKFIEEKIYHDTHIDKYGNIINKVRIQKTHNWQDGIASKWRNMLVSYGFNHIPDSVIETMGRNHNKTVTRVYAPRGSELIGVDGGEWKERYEEDVDKTVFYTEMIVVPGETKQVMLQYKLPFILQMKPASTYKLIIDKQPGSRGSLFTKTLSVDPEVLNFGTFPEEVRLDENGNLQYATNLVYDKYFSGIFGR